MPNDLRNLAIAAVSEAGGKSPRMAALLYKLVACACQDTDPAPDNDAILSFNVQGPPVSFTENTGIIPVNTTAYATFAPVSGQFIASGATAVNIPLSAGTYTIELRAATTTPGAPVTMVGGDGRLNIIQIPS